MKNEDIALFSARIDKGNLVGLPNGANAKLPMFTLGENSVNDSRRVVVTRENVASMQERFAASRRPVHVLYEHGKGPRGRISAGRVLGIDIDEDTQEVFAAARLTKAAYQAVEDEEWLGLSAGVAYDKTEFKKTGVIRPIELDHHSFENGNAIELGRPQLFVNGSWVDAADVQVEVTELPDKETPEPQAQHEAAEFNNSPAEPASDKGAGMAVNKATLELLGLAEDASDEALFAAITDLKAKAEVKVEEKTPETPAADPVDLDARMEAYFAKREAETIARIERKHEESVAKAHAESLVDGLVKEGKVTVAERDEFVALALKDVASFEKIVVPNLSKKAPVGKEVQGSGKDAAPAASTNRAEFLTKAARLAMERNTSVQAAIAIMGGDPSLAN